MKNLHINYVCKLWPYLVHMLRTRSTNTLLTISALLKTVQFNTYHQGQKVWVNV